MDVIDIQEKDREAFNKVVTHPLQSYEWGEFREKTGVKVIRRGLVENKKIIDGFSLTIHRIPKTPFTIGYLPKGNKPTKELLAELKKIGKQEKCIFIQLEPNIVKTEGERIHYSGLIPSFHPLFTKYTFVLNLKPSEEELLKNMHSKTRYNIRVAEKNGVWVEEDNSEGGFQEYMRLTDETTKRQKFYAHTREYHKLQWELFPKTEDKNNFSYHLLHAKYKDESGKTHTLTSWVVFIFHKTLYYPYGASSTEFRNVMASNLMMWEAIKFGKKIGAESFDMWGALGPEPDITDPWYGFHRFKQGYGATLTEFVGSYDLVINPALYQLYKVGDKLRWVYLKMKK